MSLSVDYDELRSRLGHFLGYSRTSTNWSAEQVLVIADALKAGLRRFYLGEQDTRKYNHDWTFLRPVKTFNTVTDQHTYDLPTDFGGLDGPMVYHPDSATLYPPVQIVPGHMILLRRADESYTTRPIMAAIEVKDPDPNVGTRHEITFWPTPDAAYGLMYRYRVDPDNLEATGKKYPLGGPFHAQTVIEACLAEAEAQMDDAPGVHEAKYQKMLIASISHDKKLRSIDTVGYNQDPRRADTHGAEGLYPGLHQLGAGLVVYGSYST